MHSSADTLPGTVLSSQCSGHLHPVWDLTWQRWTITECHLNANWQERSSLKLDKKPRARIWKWD